MGRGAPRAGLLRHPLDGPPSLGDLAAAMEARDPGADLVWLDSGAAAETGRSLLATGSRIVLEPGLPVLPQLRAALASMPALAPGDVVPLGLVGWFGYELADETMGMPVPRAPAHHRASWLAVDRGLLVDHENGTAELVALDREGAGAWSAELDAWRHEMLELLASARAASRTGDGARTAGATATAPADRPVDGAPPARRRDDDDRYAALVERCQEAIREGEAYQLCLTTSVAVEHEADIDPLALHARLRAASPAHHGALLRIGGTALVSASPETFLRLERDDEGLVVSTRPIKGTRPRGADAAADAALAAELAASDKERAENLMIVDLMRNDLSRVCALGTVTVTGLLEIETYAHVHQLVSTIEGRLRPALDALDAVAACFPAGSMTGAPKRRAMQLLAELEGAPRGVYSGCAGYLAADGTADLAMVIRSVLVEGRTATLGAGGGITALSVPVEEVAEMRLKSAALLAALGVERA
ncbi:anthranilate synthase component I family protein [Microcella daejeonensis]|uniref:anthranilate synthase component I family protein n=1 Tax=Microcella daejeonensis TaxID=2994971 RepID=UPI002271B43B|nr:anthranilate synthase component I family protein [Microcella daejeonensis]WAB83215.1 anthranilate synthase component I family protein [Microcella daejeonensis]